MANTKIAIIRLKILCDLSMEAKMEATIKLKNPSNEFLQAFEALAKVAQVEFELDKTQKPNKRLLEAIKEVERGKTIKCKDFEDFKAKVMS